MSTMGRWLLLPIVVGGAGLAAATPSATPSAVTVESGSAVFRTYCASCHGADAKGEGPLAGNLRIAPADLTRIARRNHGKFDAARVHRAIDGRDPREFHGGSDMPVWGDAFRNVDTSFDEAAAQERIRAVVDHLKTIQAGAK